MTCKAGVTSYVDRGNTENVQSGDESRACERLVPLRRGGAFVVTASSVSIGVGGMGGPREQPTGGALSLGQTSTLDCIGGATVSPGRATWTRRPKV